MKNFEIHDLTTNELLSDNLAFEEVPELLEAYTKFYSTHEIVACIRNATMETSYKCTLDTIKRFSVACINKQNHSEFLSEWLLLMEENLANFY